MGGPGNPVRPPYGFTITSVMINIMTSSNQPSSRDLMLIAALNSILLEDVDLPSGVPEWIKSKLKQLKEGTAR